jgi:predicted RND superfamily exporter protein
MWNKVARVILINRLAILIVIGLITVFMATQATKVKTTYTVAQLLPDEDTTLLQYQEFKETFGGEGSALFLGIKGTDIFELENLQAWWDLSYELQNVSEYGGDMVDSVFAITTLYNVQKNKELKRFEADRIIKKRPTTQAECDSIKDIIYNLPFYEGALFKKDDDVHIMALSMNQDMVNSKARDGHVFAVHDRVEEFSKETMIDVHYSGMPYIRTIVSTKIKRESVQFTLYAMLITAFILFLFLRSFKAVVFSLCVVIVAVVWSVGLMGILGYKITILTSLIPPLIIIIGIPNCIFLLNKYFAEFKSHGNKAKSLVRVVHKIGNATLMTNATTAAGFATFIFTQSSIMIEFGIVASLNIMAVFVLSICIIPSVYSYLKEPKDKHTKHLDREWMGKIIDILERLVMKHRRAVYIVTIALAVTAFFGLSKMYSTGRVVDDLPQDDPIMVDLKFFEGNFNGVIPFEILIKSKKEGRALKSYNIKKIDKLYKVIARHPEFSKPLSFVDVLKFSKQAYYNGNPKYYSLPRAGMNPEPYAKDAETYIKNSGGENGGLLGNFVDSTKSISRISVQIADIGTAQMDELLGTFRAEIDSIFSPNKYDVVTTGSSLIFTEGNKYLISNLVTSLTIAVVLIALFMAFMFRSWRMVIISLIPNILPLLITGAIMGYAGIPIKPSTILVFSIAFGISVDDTIHFLAKYRQELVSRDWKIKESAIAALRETGVSMFYTSVILFFGFGIFVLSGFGGTKALGMLVSLTLLIAMMANLVLLPTLLMTLNKILLSKILKEPLFEVLDEEEDIELADLEIKK